MKKLLLLAFVAITMHTIAQIPTNGLVARYDFSGNTNDGSGNNNNGTINGGVTTTTDRFGAANSAYSFNGTSGYIDCGTSSAFALNDFSISAWVLKQSSGTEICIVSKSSGVGGEIGYRLETNPDDKSDCVWSQEGIIKAGTGYVTSNTILNNTNWYHLVAIKSGSTMMIYVNGVLENTLAGMTASFNTNHPLLIGANTYISGASYFWNGKIDDIRIYNRALNANEVTQLYNEKNCDLKLTLNPTNQTISAGTSATFNVSATGTSISYQWQKNVGTGPFSNISDNCNYSGTTSSSLSVLGVASLKNSNYRCILSTPYCKDTSTFASLTMNTVYDTIKITVTDTLLIKTTTTGITPPSML